MVVTKIMLLHQKKQHCRACLIQANKNNTKKVTKSLKTELENIKNRKEYPSFPVLIIC